MVSVRTQLPEAISERASRPVPPTKADPYRRHDQRIPPGSHDMDEVLGTHSLINEYTHVARRTEDPQVTGRILFSSGTGPTATPVLADRVRLIAYGDDKPDLAASEPVLAVCAGRHSVRLTIQRD